jgi:nitrite reductase/ring-hydroxylating ferredoxin subunit
MSTKAPLKFSGYHTKLSTQEDADLTHVGKGTPGGEYLRRFWHPVALASELTGLPLALTILGEDLVLFRDKGGRLGLLHRHCSHRGASLEFGIVSERGIRCCYHGWLYDVDGTILETPSEPSERIRTRLCHGAYPTHEFAGVVFAYMGPPEEMPAFPMYDTFTYAKGDRLVPYKLVQPCNWLQAHENGADPIHTAYLHSRVARVQFTPEFLELPTIDFFETPIGLLSVATRRIGDRLWIRASDVILPNSAQFGTGYFGEDDELFLLTTHLSRWITPVDDRNCFAIGLRHLNATDPHRAKNDHKIGLHKVDFMGQTADRPYEDRQRNPGDYDAQVSQRPIAIHDNENLASTDRGVSTVRRQLRRGIEAVAKGKPMELPTRYADGRVPTYNHVVVLKVPPRPGVDDEELCRQFGRNVAEIVIASAKENPAERERLAEARVRRMILEDLPRAEAAAHAGR